jgi:hypothetical protein
MQFEVRSQFIGISRDLIYKLVYLYVEWIQYPVADSFNLVVGIHYFVRDFEV